MKKIQSKLCLLVAAFAVGFMMLGAASQAQATTIGNTGSWDGTDTEGNVGESFVSGIATLGQLITLNTSETQLDSFTVYLKPSVSGVDMYFGAYISAWDSVNLHATGPLLYSSSKQTVLGSNSDLQTFTFNTGGLNLTQGQPYILYLSASEYFTFTGQHTARVGVVRDSANNGQIYVIDNFEDSSLLTTKDWRRVSSMDLAYEATVSAPGATSAPTPEPASAALLGLGAFAMAVATRRRRSVA